MLYFKNKIVFKQMTLGLLSSIVLSGFMLSNVSADDLANNPTTTSESRPGVPKDLDTSVNEDFIKQFPYGQRFEDQDGIPATRTKSPDVPLRFKPKGYEKTITRKISYKVEKTGAVVSRIYQTIHYYGTYEYEIPKEAPVNEVTEAEIPVTSEKGTPEVNELPEFTGGVTPNNAPKLEQTDYEGVISKNGEPEVHEKPEFKGGVNPIDPPVLEIPEYKGPISMLPNNAPILDKPKYEGVIGVNGEPEVHEKPEFTGGVNPIEPPVLDAPELVVSLIPMEEMSDPRPVEKPKSKLTPKEDVTVIPADFSKQEELKVKPEQKPVAETPHANHGIVPQEEKAMLPNTGTKDNAVLAWLGMIGLSSVLGISKLKKEED